MTYSLDEIEAVQRQLAVAKSLNGKADGKARSPIAHGERPTIRTGVDLDRVGDEASSALGRAENIYQRDGMLVRVVRAAEPDERRGVVVGTPQIRAVAIPTLREELARVARWERVSKTKDGDVEASPSVPPEAIVAAVAARAEWPEVRPLAGVIETPCLRSDGSILSAPGYDQRTGLIYEPACSVVVVDKPTQDDARRALARLCDLFADFPFASEPARFVPIAAALTLIARPAIAGGTPLFAFDASTRGSGKTMVADVVSILTTGRTAPRMTFPPDEAELEKMLCSCALFGSRLVCLDNIACTLGGAPLDKVLTCEDRVQFRILGKSEMREPTWRAVVMATGNNLVFGADTGSRTLVSRLEPDVENPEERTGFRHPDLLGFVREHRGALIADALIILRAFVVAGRPGKGLRLGVGGRFVSWTDLVPAAITFAGGACVLEASAVTSGAADPDAEALRTMLGSLGTLVPGGATARTIVGLLWPQLERGERRPPDGWDDLRDAFETLMPSKRPGDPPTAKALGIALRRQKGRIAGGKRLESYMDRANVQAWRVR